MFPAARMMLAAGFQAALKEWMPDDAAPFQ